MRNNRLLEMHAAEAQVVGMGRIVGGAASIVLFSFLSFSFSFFILPCVRVGGREGGSGASETEREREMEGMEK